MIKAIILILLPVIFYLITNQEPKPNNTSVTPQQDSKKPQRANTTKVPRKPSTVAGESQSLEELFLDDDFTVTDLINADRRRK